MNKREHERFLRTIRNNLQENLKLLEEQVNRYVDPRKANAQTVFEYFLQQERVETFDSLRPDNYLKALPTWKHGIPTEGQRILIQRHSPNSENTGKAKNARAKNRNYTDTPGV